MCLCVSVPVCKGGGRWGGLFFFLVGEFFQSVFIIILFASLTWTLLPWRFLFHAKVGETRALLANLMSALFRLFLLSF